MDLVNPGEDWFCATWAKHVWKHVSPTGEIAEELIVANFRHAFVECGDLYVLLAEAIDHAFGVDTPKPDSIVERFNSKRK